MSRAWALLFSLVAFSTSSCASEPLDLATSVRGEFWSGSRDLDDAHDIKQASVWLRARKSFGNNKLFGDGWLAARHPRGAQPRGRVREAYWRHVDGPVELKLGRQMVVWGRADGLNPTDNLAPRDFTLLTPDDNDQRHGNEAVDIQYSTAFGSFSALYFPRGASHTIPLVAQFGVRYVPDKGRRSQWAAKWETSGDFDASVSYFDGSDPMPDLTLDRVGLDGVDIGFRNNPAQVLGADLSFTSDGIVWRGELAWLSTRSEGGGDFVHKKSQVWAVGGGEWTVADNTTLGLQGSIKRVFDFRSPDTVADPFARAVAWRQAATSDQWARTQLGLTWRVATRLRNDTLLAEASGASFTGPRSGVWRFKLDYAYDDSLRLQLGADQYYGSDHSFFGQLKKNSAIYLQARFTR